MNLEMDKSVIRRTLTIPEKTEKAFEHAQDGEES
jgi:hypothetical protein